MQRRNHPPRHRTNLYLCLILLIAVTASCNVQNGQAKQMQIKIDSLQNDLSRTYKPGLGDFMSGVQLHHAKLWFAGQNENWPLADFEVHEIQEAIDDIRQFCNDRVEVKAIGMIVPPLDSVNTAIKQKNLSEFKRSFYSLTNTCNTCHKATNHGFNVVVVPNNLPVVNQDFRPAQSVSK